MLQVLFVHDKGVALGQIITSHQLSGCLHFKKTSSSTQIGSRYGFRQRRSRSNKRKKRVVIVAFLVLQNHRGWMVPSSFASSDPHHPPGVGLSCRNEEPLDKEVSIYPWQVEQDDDEANQLWWQKGLLSHALPSTLQLINIKSVHHKPLFWLKWSNGLHREVLGPVLWTNLIRFKTSRNFSKPSSPIECGLWWLLRHISSLCLPWVNRT